MRVFVLLFALLSPLSAHAHKIRIFAWPQGDTILGEVAFQGGRAAKDVQILVESETDQRTLLTTATNDQGTFSFSIPDEARQNRLDLRIVADAGGGHKNHWLLKAAEYLPESVQAAPTQPSAPEPSQPVAAPKGAPPEIAQSTTYDEEKLRTVIREEMTAQLGPVQHMLAKNSERTVSLQDILGGIGYIIGLAGLAADMKTSKEQKP